MHRRLFLSLLTLLLGSQLTFAQSTSPNDQARFLAGLPVRGSGLAAIEQNRVWKEHASAMDAAWGKQELRQIARVRSWAAGNLPDSGSSATMYYMFSGPDFLYANAFFPNASTYILCGTEPVGSVPDISSIPPEQIEPALVNLRQSLKTILTFHYFITKDMRVDLQRTKLGGTLPLLYVFLARTGKVIQDVSFVNSPASGVRITFSGGAGHSQTLYYFKTNLSNGGSGGFLRWCAGQGPGLSLVKSASYLMHTGDFSNVRNFLLQNSRVIVQDDSGIPLRELERAGYNVKLFGNYAGPIELFKQHYQPDLAQAYQTGSSPDLGFAFGYHWQTDRGMLMVATKR
ncbi:hypothetical protein ACXR0O_22300 [Verrucomicrobiota bacterium sgz303538]